MFGSKQLSTKRPLYDDFRFADINDSSVIYTIKIESPWENAKFTVYGKENSFDKPLFQTDKQKELKVGKKE